jgi:hypothetical protein
MAGRTKGQGKAARCPACAEHSNLSGVAHLVNHDMSQQTIHGEPLFRPVSVLERAVNTSDGDLFDSVLSEDVIWGSPKGQIVLGLDQLNPIHRRVAANSRQCGYSSRFTLEAVGFIGADIGWASVRRTALDAHGLPLDPSQAGDSIVQEVALYVLVRRGGQWRIAARIRLSRLWRHPSKHEYPSIACTWIVSAREPFVISELRH